MTFEIVNPEIHLDDIKNVMASRQVDADVAVQYLLGAQESICDALNYALANDGYFHGQLHDDFGLTVGFEVYISHRPEIFPHLIEIDGTHYSADAAIVIFAKLMLSCIDTQIVSNFVDMIA